MRTAFLLIGLCLLTTYKSVQCQSFENKDTEITGSSVEAATFDVSRQKRTPFFFLKPDLLFEKIRQLAGFQWWKTKSVEYSDSRHESRYSTVKPRVSITNTNVLKTDDNVIRFEIKSSQRGNAIKIEKQWIAPRTTIITSTKSPYYSSSTPQYISVEDEDKSESVNESEQPVKESTEEPTGSTFEEKPDGIFETNQSSANDDESILPQSIGEVQPGSTLASEDKLDGLYVQTEELIANGKANASLPESSQASQIFSAGIAEQPSLEAVAEQDQWQSPQVENSTFNFETAAGQDQPPNNQYLPPWLQESSGLAEALPPEKQIYQNGFQAVTEQASLAQSFPTVLGTQSQKLSSDLQGLPVKGQTQAETTLNYTSSFQGLQLDQGPLQGENFSPGFLGSADKVQDANQQELYFPTRFSASEAARGQNIPQDTQRWQGQGQFLQSRLQGSYDRAQSQYGQNQVPGRQEIQRLGQGQSQPQQDVGLPSEGFQSRGPNQGQLVQGQAIQPGLPEQIEAPKEQGFPASFQGIQGQAQGEQNIAPGSIDSLRPGQPPKDLGFSPNFQEILGQPLKDQNYPSGLQGPQVQNQQPPQSQNFPSGFLGSSDKVQDVNQQGLYFPTRFSASEDQYQSTRGQNIPQDTRQSQGHGQFFPSRLQGSYDRGQSQYGQNQALGLQEIQRLGQDQTQSQPQQDVGLPSEGFQSRGPNQGQLVQGQAIQPGLPEQIEASKEQGFPASFQVIQGQAQGEQNIAPGSIDSLRPGQPPKDLGFSPNFQEILGQPLKGQNYPSGLQGSQVQNQQPPQSQNFPPGFLGSTDKVQDVNQQGLYFPTRFSASEDQYQSTRGQNIPQDIRQSQGYGQFFPSRLQGSYDRGQSQYGQNQALGLQEIQREGQGQSQPQQDVGLPSEGFQSRGPNQGQLVQGQAIQPGLPEQIEASKEQGFPISFEGIKGQAKGEQNLAPGSIGSLGPGQFQKGLGSTLALQGLLNQPPKGQNYSSWLSWPIQDQQSPQTQNFATSPELHVTLGQHEAQPDHDQNISPGFRFSSEKQGQAQQNLTFPANPEELRAHEQSFSQGLQAVAGQRESQLHHEEDIQQSLRKIQGLSAQEQGVQWLPEQSLNSVKTIEEANVFVPAGPLKPDELQANDRDQFQQPGPSERNSASNTKNGNNKPSADTDIVELTGPASDEDNASTEKTRFYSGNIHQLEHELNIVDKSISLDNIARVSGPGDESSFVGDIRRATGDNMNRFGLRSAAISVPIPNDSPTGNQLQTQLDSKLARNTPRTALEHIRKNNQAPRRYVFRKFTTAARIL